MESTDTLDTPDQPRVKLYLYKLFSFYCLKYEFMYLWRVNVLIWLQHVVGICRRTWKSINNCYCDMLGSWPWRAWKRCPLYPCLNSYGCIVLRLPRPKNHNKYCRNGCCNWQNSNCKFIEIFFNNVMSWIKQ